MPKLGFTISDGFMSHMTWYYMFANHEYEP